MKKILLSAIIALGAISANAQDYGFNEGDVFVEGMLGYNSEDDTAASIKESNFTFTPKVGFMITEDFALGLQLGFGMDKTENYGINTENKNNSFGVGVFGRYYFAELTQRIKVYSELGLGYNSYKTENRIANVTAENKASGFGINAGLGINYFVTPKIAINFGFSDLIGYNTYKPENGDATNNFHLNINNFNNFFDNARFGMTFKF
jgi:outer membrane protein